MMSDNCEIINIKNCEIEINEIIRIKKLLESIVPIEESHMLNFHRDDINRKLGDYNMKRRLLVNMYLFRIINEVIGTKKAIEILIDLPKKNSIYSCKGGMICKTGIRELDNKIRIEDFKSMENILT